MYKNYNHNGALLGEFKTRKKAKADAKFYREQTGNPVEIIRIKNKTFTKTAINQT